MADRMEMSESRPADAVAGNWVDRFAPSFARPYLRLMRADRPIGMWLLLWPCWWSAALAAPHAHEASPWPDPWHLALFLVGAYVMRGAGCAFNDIVDRNFDGAVERTRGRPIPSGAIGVPQAWAFLVGLCLIGLAILLSFNGTTVLLGFVSLGLVAIYPFMKRFTYWPQVFLGLAFNWGALMGWTAATGALALPALILYGAGISWTLVYDTIYGHQDKEDDLLIGVKSTALKFGAATKPWLSLFGALVILGLATAGWLAGIGFAFYAGLAIATAHLTWQIATLDYDNPEDCLKKFRANHPFGAIVFAAIVAGHAI